MTYYMVLLRRGPAWTATATSESAAVSKGHQENIQKLTADGKMVVAGPFLDQTGAQALAGLFILRVASLDEAKATVSTDPAVKTSWTPPTKPRWPGNVTYWTTSTRAAS